MQLHQTSFRAELAALVAAFDKWKHDTSPTTVIAATDAALDGLSSAFAAQVKRTITKDELEGSLSAALVQIEAENSFWAEDPGDSFPHAELDGVCQQLVTDFLQELKTTENALFAVEGWKIAAKDFAENLEVPTPP